MARQDAQQLTLDFTSSLNERLALIRSLHNVLIDRLPGKWTPQRWAGVIDLLERIAVCSDDKDSKARVCTIGTLAGRRKVTERTVRTWRQGAESLGLLTVDARSRRWGHHYPNLWIIQFDAIRRLLATTTPAPLTPPTLGRKRGGSGAEGTAAPRAEGTAAPRAEATSAPYYLPSNYPSPPTETAGGGGGNLASAPETAGDAWTEAEQAVHAADVALAETAVQAARSRGCTAAEVLAACSYHRSRPDLGGGALYAKLRGMRPGDRPDRGFPPLARSAQLAQRVETATRQEQAQQQAEAQERQRDAETAATLEARYGPAVDALSPAEIEALLPQPLLRIYRREGTPVGLVRELLLARLSKEETHVPP